MDAYPAAVEALDVRKTYGSGVAETVAVAGITARFEKGRVHGDRGPVGVGQDHVAALAGWVGCADFRPGDYRWHGHLDAFG